MLDLPKVQRCKVLQTRDPLVLLYVLILHLHHLLLLQLILMLLLLMHGVQLIFEAVVYGLATHACEVVDLLLLLLLLHALDEALLIDAHPMLLL